MSSKNPQLPSDQYIPPLGLNSPAVDDLFIHLSHSLALRTINIPTPPSRHVAPAKLAILFSGGLDCSLLARIVHDLVPLNEDVDLLNVAFENPRVLKAANASNASPTSGYLQCPDRITGLSSYAELQRVCPGRTWRFVSIDVPYAETVNHRPQITSLIYPHNTEMDLSIACALYFAARGKGNVENHAPNDSEPYSTPARVLLSGLGADEIFAGYTRHATAFARRGYQGLSDELDMDFHRLGKRNLGRDDRVISHWGREVRYPYLDEDFLHWALNFPVREKCGFGQQLPPSPSFPDCSTGSENPEFVTLEPGKLLLRLLAYKLGMRSAAAEKKRAIQFGARTAKMEAGKTKGTQKISPWPKEE